MTTANDRRNPDIDLMAHLYRRAAFGASRAELDAAAQQGYEESVERLLNPPDTGWMGDFMVRRFDHEASGMINGPGSARNWLYRMVTSRAPLQEKMTLFWHGIFATGVPKVINGRVLSEQIDMFRRCGMGRFDDLLLALARDPAMIVWLDNQDNHSHAINENWGRELLELFSMGVGNYTEQDIKECARAFTGWTIRNAEYMMVRSARDSDWPYGRIAYQFERRADDHDDGEKTFLGHTGNFDGEDIIAIICRQESTARFIARHMYHFFVADEPPVPSWPYTPPRDNAAIDALVASYFDSGCDIGAMLRTLFHSDFFKAEDIRYEKVKSPAEFAVGILRMSGEFAAPRREMILRYRQIDWMGQALNNPPSVEGWHQGLEWLDTGTLMERINFASEQLGDPHKPGVRAMAASIAAPDDNNAPPDPDTLVDRCLDQMGALTASPQTRAALLTLARQPAADPSERATQMLRLTAASREFQRV